MDTKKAIAILIVIILAVSVITAVVYANQENNKKTVETSSGCLQVYGNVNNDDVIDATDITLLNQIISQKLDWEEKYSFADTNHDGQVNADDVTALQNIIDATPSNKAKAFIVCYATDRVDGYVEGVMIPITNAAIDLNQTDLKTFMTMGMRTEFSCATFSNNWADSTDPYFQAEYKNLETNCVGTYIHPDATIIANYCKGSYASNPVTCYIMGSGCGYDYYHFRDSLNDLSISVIHISDYGSTFSEYGSSMLMLGFLFGTDSNQYQQRAIELSQYFNGLQERFQAALDKIDSGSVSKITGLLSSAKNYISSPSSSYRYVVEEAGINYVMDTTKEWPKTMISYDSSKDTWANEYEPDLLVALSGKQDSQWSWLMDNRDDTKIPQAIKDHIQTFRTMKNYSNAIVLSSVMPVPFEVLYLSEYAYPEVYAELYGQDFAQQELQYYFHTYLGMSSDCLKDKPMILTMDDLGLTV